MKKIYGTHNVKLIVPNKRIESSVDAYTHIARTKHPVDAHSLSI